MDKNSRILVTGANGHVGFNLVKMLIDNGYSNVRSSVRNSSNTEKTAALKEIGVSDIVSLDIRDPAAFVCASKDIEVLFHVAATYKIFTDSQSAANEMVEDSVQGVRNALLAAEQNEVRKVVLTSSSITLRNTPKNHPAATESDWRIDFEVPYILAKTKAEKLAWEIAEQKGINLATILPSAVLGPNFGQGTQSTDMIYAAMKGMMRMGTAKIVLPIVDVRDVASGHIAGAEQDAKGRFIIAGDTMPMYTEIMSLMHKIDGSIGKPLMIIPTIAYAMLPTYDWLMNKLLGTPRTLTSEFISTIQNGQMLYDNSKAKRELGWAPQYSVEQTLRDTMEELKRKES